ncbi:hypothetical protein [Burkholderia thailandensis]|uniref:hypothetical protein n=1 Tax=Burkholderia thailandensis TaxID=57975 RepID=UPI00217E152B|nr:hypothetical protein [Burkholderia thailandensis]
MVGYQGDVAQAVPKHGRLMREKRSPPFLFLPFVFRGFVRYADGCALIVSILSLSTIAHHLVGA